MKQHFMLGLFLASFYLISNTEGRPYTGNFNAGIENSMTIFGKVVEEGSSIPVNTTLTIQVKGYQPIETSTDAEGNFSVSIPRVEAFKIVVKADGFESQVNTIEYATFEEGELGNIEIRLTPSVKLRLDGLILSEKDRSPLEVEFNVYRFSDFIKMDSKQTRDGKYSQSLTDFGWYMIDFSAPGYVEVRDTFWVLNCRRKVIHKNYYLAPIEKGLTMLLNEIQFNFGKTTLRPDSYPELDQIARFLSRNPSLKIEVGGHTDSDGPDDYNMFLSQARAQAVLNYLIDNGISKDQMVAKGYGASKPIETNETRAGKAKNRRVELVVLSNSLQKN